MTCFWVLPKPWTDLNDLSVPSMMEVPGEERLNLYQWIHSTQHNAWKRHPKHTSWLNKWINWINQLINPSWNSREDVTWSLHQEMYSKMSTSLGQKAQLELRRHSLIHTHQAGVKWSLFSRQRNQSWSSHWPLQTDAKRAFLLSSPYGITSLSVTLMNRTHPSPGQRTTCLLTGVLRE